MDIYVGNLPYQLEEKELEDLFGQFGSVKTVKVVKDPATGKSKGFGFVTMDDKDGDKAIAELDGKEFKGRNIRVNRARPRAEGSGGGGPRGGGSFGGGGGGPRRGGPRR